MGEYVFFARMASLLAPFYFTALLRELTTAGFNVYISTLMCVRHGCCLFWGLGLLRLDYFLQLQCGWHPVNTVRLAVTCMITLSGPH